MPLLERITTNIAAAALNVVVVVPWHVTWYYCVIAVFDQNVFVERLYVIIIIVIIVRAYIVVPTFKTFMKHRGLFARPGCGSASPRVRRARPGTFLTFTYPRVCTTHIAYTCHCVTVTCLQHNNSRSPRPVRVHFIPSTPAHINLYKSQYW